MRWCESDLLELGTRAPYAGEAFSGNRKPQCDGERHLHPRLSSESLNFIRSDENLKEIDRSVL